MLTLILDLEQYLALRKRMNCGIVIVSLMNIKYLDMIFSFFVCVDT